MRESPVKADREKQGMTQNILAKRIGISRPAVSLIERGELIPSISTLSKMYRILKTNNKRKREIFDFYAKVSEKRKGQ